MLLILNFKHRGLGPQFSTFQLPSIPSQPCPGARICGVKTAGIPDPNGCTWLCESSVAAVRTSQPCRPSAHQVLCPRCDIGTLSLKRKQKKLKEPMPSAKKKSTKLESLSDLERALCESKDTASAVSTAASLDLEFLPSSCNLFALVVVNFAREGALCLWSWRKTEL